MSPLIQRAYPADAAALGEVRENVRTACLEAGCSAECAGELVLAVNEACMNIIQHGYRYAEGETFTLRLSVLGAKIVVYLLDNGTRVEEAALKSRELDDLRPGGLGVRFMRELTDSVNYLEAPQDFINCLQMVKRIY
jgi:anti-sigma regulatory factor (Ser/Thr protein kinase)